MLFISQVNGFKETNKNEDPFRKKFILALILVSIGLVIRESGIQKATLIFSVVTILINRIINSAIENL